jgi:hypothetical protein
MAIVIESKAGKYSKMETRIPLPEDVIDGLVLYGVIRFGKEKYPHPLKEDFINFLAGEPESTSTYATAPYYGLINIDEPAIAESLKRLKNSNLVEEYIDNSPSVRLPGSTRLKAKIPDPY